MAIPSGIANLKLLNRDDYEDWSFRVKTYLLAEDLWDVVEPAPGNDEPPEREDGEAEFKVWRKNNARALHAIQGCCGNDAYAVIRGISMARVAWNALAENYLQPADEVVEEDKLADGDVGSETELPTEPVEAASTERSRSDQLWALRNMMQRFIINQTATRGQDPIDANLALVHETFVNFIESTNDWEAAMEYLNEHPEAITARLSSGGTALNRAVLLNKAEIAKVLVRLMAPEEVEIQDPLTGQTALYTAVVNMPEDIELAKCMVEKTPRLLTILRSGTSMSPLIMAQSVSPLLMAQSMEKGEKMACYLYSITPPDTIDVFDAAELISAGFRFKRFDIAWDLIQRNPVVALIPNFTGGIPLTELAAMPSAFLSGSRLRFWEKWIYNSMHIAPSPTINDISINIQNPEITDQSNQRHLFSVGLPIWICNTVMGLFRGRMTDLLKLLGANRLYEMKLIHVRVLEFLPRMCEAMRNRDIRQLRNVLETAMFQATERGHVEYIVHITRANPTLRWITKENSQTLFQCAAECRQEKIYSLIYRLGENSMIDAVACKDKSGNNMLHIVATYTALAQNNHVRGAALQMQRELQWFKEVESVANPAALEVRNHTDHMTPRELFTKSHKELLKEGEQSMKETANSCTVVATLIVTMMFAAAFTVPGGNNGDTGLPIFLNDKVFTAFIVSDAISLFSSTTSVMIFLGILNSRYAENDFLISLPTNMILGLITLFLSIATMMISFSCALFIMVDGKSSIVIPSILFSSVPITLFAWMQFPFLVEIFISTFGAGIFDREVKDWT